jgi:probable addiction module antidote protein
MTVETTPFDPAEHLLTPDDIAGYLNSAMSSGNAAVIADALGICMRANNFAKLARDTGLNRQTLYRSLSHDGNPELATVLKVVEALGVQLIAVTPTFNPTIEHHEDGRTTTTLGIGKVTTYQPGQASKGRTKGKSHVNV